MIVIGIDLSLRSTGLVAVPHTFATSVEWASVRHTAITSGSMPRDASVREHAARLQSIADRILAWARNDRADLIAMEEQAFNMKGAHARELGELTGVVKTALLELEVPLLTVPASTARKTLLGKVPRAGAKDAVVDVLRRMGAPFTTADEADAFTIANHVLSLHGFTAVTVREAA